MHRSRPGCQHVYQTNEPDAPFDFARACGRRSPRETRDGTDDDPRSRRRQSRSESRRNAVKLWHASIYFTPILHMYCNNGPPDFNNTNLNLGQDTRANRTQHTSSSDTGPHSATDITRTHTPNRQTSLTHTQIAIRERCQKTTPPASRAHTHSATRLGDHRLRELHRPLRQRLCPSRPLPLHLPLPPDLVELEASEARVL